MTLPQLPAPDERPVGRLPFTVSFQAHLELLRVFLARRDEIVERIAGVLNAQRKPLAYQQDGSILSRHVDDCFFALPGVSESQWRLRGQLEEAHWASGFKPRDIRGLHNGPADPAELMMRAFYLWRQTRWPGGNGRNRYAHTLFNLYVMRRLELLSMRVWDDGERAGERLSQIQAVLDQLWEATPAGQPALVRDARWLIQMAQSLATDDLGAYFDVAARIAYGLPAADQIEIHKAGVRMTGGHLRSQIRYYAIKNAVALDDHGLTLITRTSNALDFALLIQELVPLLDAYELAARSGDHSKRLDLADAICQGISPDPDLFVNRVELLAAYSMIEHLFIATDGDGQVAYSPMGRRHLQLIQQYQSLIGQLAAPLYDDCARFRPVAGAYSPYGVLYGFSADLVKHMALKASQPDSTTRFGLEDVFVAGDADSGKLTWVNGWRKLPHLRPDVEKQFDYPHQFAEDVFQRIEDALRTRASSAGPADDTGRLFIASADDQPVEAKGLPVPALQSRYVGSSDTAMVAAQKAEWSEEARLLSDRREGRCVLSYETTGGWVAISKSLLTEVLGAGSDARISELPPTAAEVLKLMCPNLVVRR